jgi:hypothetical protein
MSEKNIQSLIMAANVATMFRNNQGRGVLGEIRKIPNTGDFIVKHGRIVDFGVCNPGGSDLIGWKSVTITPDMVGKKLAVFTGLEVKTSTGRPTKEQVNFIQAVRSAGGFAGIVRSVDDAVAVCNPIF